MKSDEEYRPRITRRSEKHDIRGVDYQVSEWGEPSLPLLVLLHGWSDTGSSFQFFVDALRNDWFVIAPDWRGWSATAWAQTLPDCTQASCPGGFKPLSI